MIKPISFGKELIATCQLPKIADAPLPCKIFQINNKEDFDYFSKLKNDSNWSDSKFVWVMNRLMNSKTIGKSKDTFAIETLDGNCLGYINVITHEPPYNRKSIQYLEVSPQFDFDKKNQKQDVIAKTLLSVIVDQAEKESRDYVMVLAFDSKTRKFYTKKCGFKHGDDGNYDFILNNKNFNKFLGDINKNARIEFLV